MSEARPAARGRVPWITVVVGLLALFTLLILGTWQVERLAWKEGLLAKIDQRIHSEPVSLVEIESRYEATIDVDYTPLRLSGKLLHDGEAHFFATWKGESGFFVYTPLELADGRAILVNRGFVPYDKKDPATRPAGQTVGQVEIVGLARDPVSSKPSALVPDNDPAKNIFYWKDISAMAAHAGIDPAKLVPFFLDAGDAPNPGGLPVGGVTLIDLPNNHLQYAITWYGLAAALAAVLGVWLWRAGAIQPLIVAGSVVLILLAMAVVVRACGAANDKISRCDDPTSGLYIWDDARRGKECHGAVQTGEASAP